MRYGKIAGCVLVTATLLLSAWAAASREDMEPARIHQHRQTLPPNTEEDGLGADGTLSTHLPVVSIDTRGQTIPGLSASAVMAPVEISIYDRPGEQNRTDEPPEIRSEALIKYRGNTSINFDKKNYRIKFVGEDGEERRVAAMGMGAHDDWVLHGPFLDKTLMRNYMWYNVAGEIMEWAPNPRFCELLVDGEYRGVYVMTETISDGRDCRLNISDTIRRMDYWGYILRLDRGSEKPVKNIQVFSDYTLRNRQVLNIEYPAAARLTPKVLRDIQDDFSAFEKALYSFDYDSEKYGYHHFIDTDSFVDYLILNEFTCNYDAGNLSTYVYKDLGGKLKMAVWDWNSACDNYLHPVADPMVFQFQNNLWFYMLMKDDDFTERVISRYRELRKTFLSDEYLLAYIDETKEYLGSAVERNYSVWGYTFDEAEDMLQPTGRNPRSFDEAVEQMKTFIVRRGAWMDDNIEILRQYSHESKVKKFNH